MKHLLFVLLSLILSWSTYAADLPKLRDLFEQEFTAGYTEGECGKNVEEFVKKAKFSGINIQGVMLLEIQQGGNLFVYHARSNGPKPDRRVFFHHYAIVVSQNGWSLDSQDFVIDFDFGNQPRIVLLKEYLETMLMSPRLRGKPELVDKDFEIGLTRFTVANAQAFVSSKTPSERKQALLFKDLKMKEVYRSLW